MKFYRFSPPLTSLDSLPDHQLAFYSQQTTTRKSHGFRFRDRLMQQDTCKVVVKGEPPVKGHRFTQLLVIGVLATLLAACGILGSAPPSSIVFAPGIKLPTAMKTNSAATLAATDNNGSSIQWSVTCKSLQCGVFTPPITTDTTTTTYHAPASVPAGGTVTITATSRTDYSASVSATITISESNNSLADGTYVFHLSGEDFNALNGISNYYVAGAFTVSGGLITGGEQDFSDYFDFMTDTFDPATSSMQSTADGNLQIVLGTADWIVGVNGVETIHASVVNSSRALISEFDSFGSSTGTLDLQASTPSIPSFGYAFFLSGLDHPGAPLGLGGIVNVDGSGTISGSGSVFDMNDAGVVAQDLSFDTSTVTTPDSFGRVQFNLQPGANLGMGNISLIGYIVDNKTIRVVEGIDNFMGITAGTLIGQGSNTGGFTNGSIAGSTYVISAEGVDPNGPLQLAGALSFSASDASMSGNLTFNDLISQITASNIANGAYSVDPTGRATISGLTSGALGPATLQLYLDGNGNAMTVSMDSSDVTAGYAFLQTAGASLGVSSYAVSADGTSPPTQATPPWQPLSESNVPWSATGTVSADGNGNITGFTDLNVFQGSLMGDVALTGTATANGSSQVLSGMITGLDAVSSTAQDSFVYYVVDGTRFVAIETDGTQLGLGFFESQQ